MNQFEFQFGNSITYSELQKLCSKEYYVRGSKLISKIDSLLYNLENKPGIKSIKDIFMDLNEESIELSSLDSKWIEFSNIIMRYTLLFEGTSYGPVKELREIFKEIR